LGSKFPNLHNPLTATHYLPPTEQSRTPLSRRAAAFALALAIEILLLLAFFTINFRERRKPEFEGGRLTTFDIAAESEQDTTRSIQKEQQIVTRPRPRAAPPIPKPTIELPQRPLQMIEVTREEFLNSDIARLGTAANGPSGPQLASRGSGRSPGDSALVGTAPNGEPLYAAEWYREPTNQELSTYMPKRMPDGGGWGMVACKTAARYRVTDCVELGQAPAGSHLAGAVRQAAWQFLVRPPRIGGKPMIGEWVRIRITYTVEHQTEMGVQ
jgi:protein TonB